MEIKIIKQLEIETHAGDFHTTKAGIDESSMPFLFEMMSKNLYSNPIGSIVREITSNCFDSHIEANSDDPVIISIKDDEEGEFISFKDFGVGLSPLRIKKIYMNYFSSTKRSTNNQIGGFGLGSKTPLSYAEFFYITTISDLKSIKYFNNRKAPYYNPKEIEVKTIHRICYEYIYSRGETVPTLDLLTKKETSEKVGTEIKIYFIEDKDRQTFINECKIQLCYFDNVYFSPEMNINNEYYIFDKPLYKFRSHDRCDPQMHICYGKVNYPINWKELGFKSEAIPKIPVGIKFEIGELLVTPNRESLRYTDEIKTLVKEKILLVLEELKNEFLEKTKPIEDLLDWIDIENTRPHIIFEAEDDKYKLHLTGMGLEKEIRFKPFEDLGIKLNSSDINFFTNYNVIREINNTGYSNSHITMTNLLKSFKTDSYREKDKILLFDGNDIEKDIIKKIYVKELIYNEYLNSNNDVYLVQERSFNYSSVSSILGLQMTYKDKFGVSIFHLGKAKQIYAYIKIVKSYITPRLLDFRYEDIVVPEEFKKEYRKREIEKTAAWKRKMNNKFLIKDFWNGSGRDKEVSEAEYCDNNRNRIVIYGSRKDKTLLEKAVILLKQHGNLDIKVRKSKRKKKSGRYEEVQRAAVIMIAESNFKHFKNKKNMCHVTELYSDNKIFRKVATSFRIEKLLQDLVDVQEIGIDSFISEIKKIYLPTGELMEELLKYRDRFKDNHRYYGFQRSDLLEDVLKIAIKHNYFDMSILYKIEAVEEWFKNIEVLKFTRITDKSLPSILHYLREKKKKLNLEYYAKITNEDYHKVLKEEEGQLYIDFGIEEEKTNIFKFKTVA